VTSELSMTNDVCDGGVCGASLADSDVIRGLPHVVARVEGSG
jgi:hypothetical protein